MEEDIVNWNEDDKITDKLNSPSVHVICWWIEYVPISAPAISASDDREMSVLKVETMSGTVLRAGIIVVKRGS